MGSGFMERTISSVTQSGAETPIKTSALYMASFRLPFSKSRFVISEIAA